MKRSDDPAVNEKLLRQLLVVSENMLDMVSLADRSGILEYVSPSHKRYLGYEPEYLVGRSLLEFVHPEDLERVRVGLLELQESGELKVEEIRYRCADGSYVWLEAIGRRIADEGGKPVGMIFSSRDITARLETEQQIRRLTAAIEESPDGVIINDLTGCILYANKAAGRLYGWPPAELQGARIMQLHATTEHVEPAYNALLERGQWSGETLQQRRDGSRFLASLSLFSVRNDKNQPQQVVAFVRDISHQRKLEEQLHHARKMEAVGRLAGGIAHDFNNILQAIGGYAELIQARLIERTPIYADAEEICKASERAGALTRQLLTFSRKQVVVPQDFRPSEVLERSEGLLRRVIGENIQLECTAAADLWPVQMDPTQLDQVLVNLVANARDAMPGGGRLSIDLRNITLTVDDLEGQADVAPGEYVRLTVCDSGEGMTKEVRERIFEPFFSTREQTGVVRHYSVLVEITGFPRVWLGNGGRPNWPCQHRSNHRFSAE